MPLTPTSKSLLVSIFARQATTAPGGAQAYLRSLLDEAAFPERWQERFAGSLTGDARVDARTLLRFTDGHGSNPNVPGWTASGSLLRAILPDLGVEDAQTTVAIMLAEDLIHDPRSRTELRRGYNVPDLMEPTSSDAAAPVGGVAADIPWLSDEVGYEDLHGVLSRRVPLKVEVGTLREAARRARSVCRIEDATGNALGSGFRVSETSVLTNAHVLGMTDPEIRQAARTAAVRFNFTSDTERLGIPTERYLVDRREPLLAHSGVRELDFALLRIDRSVRDSPNVGVTELSRPAAVLAGGSLRLIGHPDQEFMSLSMLDNAILKVDRDRGFLHYACIGFPGQSGAPCFNHEWSPVALHRKAQARRGPVVQEGVLVEALLGSIARFL